MGIAAIAMTVLALVYYKYSGVISSPVKASPNPTLLINPSFVREYPVDIDSLEFAQTVHHFFAGHGHHVKPSAPVELRNNWWRIGAVHFDPAEALLILTPAGGEVGDDFELRLQLIGAPPQRPKLLVNWSLLNAPDHVEAIVSYTIDELRLELTARSRVKNGPNATGLHGTLVKARDANSISAISRLPASDLITGKAFWPSPQDYNEALQNPSANFGMEVLKTGKPELTALGLPRAATGAFASVYRLNVDKRAYAVKCFLTLVHDQKDRYELISNSILGDDLECTVDFEFVQKGILVQGKWFPIVRMDWVCGEPLNLYVEQRLGDSAAIEELAEQFLDMMRSLHTNGIAHGDLQHGNILVTKDGIRLVDYDGMFVPGMEEMVSNELGHRNFQHPSRHPTHFGAWLDNFSALTIYLSLRALASDSSLWRDGGAGDECLIFRQADFVNPQDSALLKTCDKHSDELVRSCSETLRQALELPLDEMPFLDLLRT